jgi:uncharacterized protein YndB with AHSA1/START domain
MSDPIVKVTRTFDTIPELVFDAWLDTAMLERWMFGSGVRDEEIIHLQLEPKVGGRFSFLVRRNGDEIDHVGRYLEIDSPRRLVFTWGIVGSDNSSVAVEIAGDDKGCELILTHFLHPDWADHVERTRQGWAFMLGKLAEALQT